MVNSEHALLEPAAVAPSNHRASRQRVVTVEKDVTCLLLFHSFSFSVTPSSSSGVLAFTELYAGVSCEQRSGEWKRPKAPGSRWFFHKKTLKHFATSQRVSGNQVFRSSCTVNSKGVSNNSKEDSIMHAFFLKKRGFIPEFHGKS